MRWIIAFAASTVWAFCTADRAQSGNLVPRGPSVIACDVYAAENIPLEQVNPGLAIPACANAVQKNPNSPRLLFELGRAYHKYGDFNSAAALYQQAADQGFAPAETGLGFLYAIGRGVPQDYAQARLWYRKAADQGYSHAQHDVGVMYANGQGVPQDYSQAAVWYRKAADQGFAAAQYNLGLLYENGQGVAQDYVQALTWYSKAAEQGLKQAENNLAILKLKMERNEKMSDAKQKGYQGATVREHPDNIDAAIGDCMDAQIASGRYFNLPIREAGLRLMVVCQRQATAWIADCERQTRNSEGCTQAAVLISQTLIKNAWYCVNHSDDPKCVDLLPTPAAASPASEPAAPSAPVSAANAGDWYVSHFGAESCVRLADVPLADFGDSGVRRYYRAGDFRTPQQFEQYWKDMGAQVDERHETTAGMFAFNTTFPGEQTQVMVLFNDLSECQRFMK